MRKQLLTKMLLIAASLFVGTSAWAGVLTLYQQNFNSETGVPTGWTQANGTLSLEVSGENKWLRETTAGSGSRTAWYTGSAIKDAIGSHTSYTLEFDCLIKEGTNTGNYAQGVWVTGSNLAQSWGTPTGYAIGVMKGSNATTYTIQANGAATGETVNLSSNTWYHYVCAYDHSTKKITFSILSQDKSSTIYAAKTFDYDYSADGKGVFQSIHFQAGRGSGYTELDNILLTTVSDDEAVTTPSIAVAYAGANRTVTITPGESSESNAVTTYYTLDGSDPTSSSSVYSLPLDIDADCTVKAISISSTSVASTIASQTVTVGKLKLATPTFTKTGYADGSYTVSMSSNQSGLAYPPASTTLYYSIDGGAATAYSSAISVAAGSTVTGYVTATNYTNSDNANLTTAVRPVLAEVWSIDFAGQATEDKGAVTVGTEAFTANGTSFGNISGAFTSNDNFGVKTGSSWLLRNNSRGLYSGNGSGTPVGVAGLTAGQYIKMVVSDMNSRSASGAASLVEDMSTTTELYIVANEDGNANINFNRYAYIKSIAVCNVVTSVPATLGTNGYATFASAYPLDLTTANLPAGVKAYKASVSGTTVTFTELNQTVPANTGILLEGTGTSVDIPVAASGTTVTGNAFEVNTTGATFAGDDDYYYFGLVKNTLTFGKFAPSSVAIPANKAYLKVLKTSVDASARELNVVFGDEATGINAIPNSEVMNNDCFDLQGRRVANPTKGLYIVNGKKVIVK